ncbi:MAG: hypothetical protein HY210_02330 [Candidatus Omnitrophica bacterium]|nr:hypothetical protein [Candidatus Omnitrophota bacterium]
MEGQIEVLIVGKNRQQVEDIKEAVESLFVRDSIIRGNSEMLRKIGLFVLLIGKLEDRVKTLLFARNPQPDIWDRMTLGAAIKEFGKQLPTIKDEYDKKPRDYRLKNFLDEDNIQRFISQCDNLNKLRNDLIHNFVSPQRSGLENIPQILNHVDRMLIGTEDWEVYRRGRISQEVLKGYKTKDDLVCDQLHLRTHEGSVRDDLPLEGLIEIWVLVYDLRSS